jgi:hypothetical protein
MLSMKEMKIAKLEKKFMLISLTTTSVCFVFFAKKKEKTNHKIKVHTKCFIKYIYTGHYQNTCTFLLLCN